jgi:hypothetical protein
MLRDRAKNDAKDPAIKTHAFEFERARLLLREQPRRACSLQMLRNFGVSSDVSEVLGMKLAAVVAV